MEKPPDWRSENYAKAYENYDRTDFAQEFLRRNPQYRAEYRAVMKSGRSRDLEREEEMARRWGLSFSLST